MASAVLSTIQALTVVHGLVGQLNENVLGGAQHRPNGEPSRRDTSKGVEGSDLALGEARPATEDSLVALQKVRARSRMLLLLWRTNLVRVASSQSMTNSIQVTPPRTSAVTGW